MSSVSRPDIREISVTSDCFRGKIGMLFNGPTSRRHASRRLSTHPRSQSGDSGHGDVPVATVRPFERVQ
jgi:hypothetical protein